MASKLKALGLVMVAVFAMSAVAASGASAAETFHSESEHTILDAQALQTQVFTTEIGAVECEEVAVDSTIGPNVSTTHEITAIPTYGKCKANVNGTLFNADIKPTSCDYNFSSTTTSGTTDAPVQIKCNTTGDEIDVNVTVGKTEVNCIKVPAQTVDGVHYENTGAGNTREIDINPTVTGIEYTKVGVCGSGKANNGTYTGKVTVKGTNTAAEQVGVWWE